jgi:hypothetical protein
MFAQDKGLKLAKTGQSGLGRKTTTGSLDGGYCRHLSNFFS